MQHFIVLSFATLYLTCAVPAFTAPNNWPVFANRAGWSIKYPPKWQVGSCNNCTDLTDPDVFVTFFDPSTGGLVRIQQLAGRPSDQPVKKWLDDLKEIVVANPRESEQWFTLNGDQALRVKTRNPDFTASENIYVVNGRQTFFIQASPSEKIRFYALYKEMLSSFRFTTNSSNVMRHNE